MSRHHRNLVLVVLAVVVAWGGVHLVTVTPMSVAPAVWPGAVATPRSAVASPRAPSPALSASAAADSVPILPGAMQRLNAGTAATATGVWALLRQLESALARRLGQLVGQLEAGR